MIYSFAKRKMDIFPSEWIDEQTQEFFTTNTYYILMVLSLIPMLILFRIIIEIGVEFFMNN
jgi:hypothetical protein